ncbi:MULTISPECIES: sigma factor-like helix-turn-helix DNA-binding protein [unclassified Nocardia]|uniref:sigma factor-like helix-turn-helix DNA-binding protein n=1 Tax=unclassified Nocardia TaxID=2637762 RepID=UPI001CE3BF7F|nr:MULTISPECIES: sigma factor-like helix-turn-helix DNA-binding protein [unclassified Nocardia]
MLSYHSPRPEHRALINLPSLDSNPQDEAKLRADLPNSTYARSIEPIPDWETTASRLAGYAFNILQSWIVNGAIVGRVRNATGIRLAWRPELRELDTAKELAGMTIAVALDRFRIILSDGRWEPTRGSMETYFIGQCLLRFPNEYHRWLREYQNGAPPYRADLKEIEKIKDNSIYGDPESTTLSRLATNEILGKQNNIRVRLALLLYSQGCSHQDIAQHLNTTPKAVEMLLYRMRRRRTSPRPRWQV